MAPYACGSIKSVRERPSGCVTGKPSSIMTMLRTPKPLRAFDPRMEMPQSRGPLPSLTVMPGLPRTRSSTPNAGDSFTRSFVTVVTGWPAGCCKTFGAPGSAGAEVAAGVMSTTGVGTRGAAARDATRNFGFAVRSRPVRLGSNHIDLRKNGSTLRWRLGRVLGWLGRGSIPGALGGRLRRFFRRGLASATREQRQR